MSGLVIGEMMGPLRSTGILRSGGKAEPEGEQ